MKKQPISFETAKLAKEKEFDIKTTHYYLVDEKKHILNISKEYSIEGLNWNVRSTRISAPTQSLLQKWLREVHDIDISIRLNQFGYGYMYAINNIKSCENIIELKGGPNYKWTYEEALEVGLQEALKLIK